MKTLLVERLKDLRQSDEPQKDTLYYVQLDTNEVLWIKEGDLVDLACELGDPQNAVELMEYFIKYGILVDIPGDFQEDVNELIKENAGIGEHTKKEQSKMNKKQERQILKGIYNAAINCILKAVDDRHDAVYEYEKYIDTVEQTVQVFSPDFDLEKGLELVPRGLNIDILRYITSLDFESRKQQLNFYQDIRRSL